MNALYNEIDPHAAQWIRNLVAAGLVAPGEVEERSIRDLRPGDVGAAQFHAFAGIAVWSHALRVAGWPDELPVWTGSCPCQPFSSAGKRGGFDDERHLWPAWFDLIRECRPPVVLGEQVASRDGLAWFDAVHADLEGAGYAVGALDLCAAGVGAPHIRQRLYFVAVDDTEEGRRRSRRTGEALRRSTEELDRRGATVELGDTQVQRSTWRARLRREAGSGPELAGVLGDAGRARGGRDAGALPREEGGAGWGVRREPDVGRDGATRGFWSPADWIPCSDGKSRPVEPGTFPLAHGVAGRVGKLRAYGNAIVAPLATEFIRAVMARLVAA